MSLCRQFIGTEVYQRMLDNEPVENNKRDILEDWENRNIKN